MWALSALLKSVSFVCFVVGLCVLAKAIMWTKNRYF